MKKLPLMFISAMIFAVFGVADYNEFANSIKERANYGKNSRILERVDIEKKRDIFHLTYYVNGSWQILDEKAKEAIAREFLSIATLKASTAKVSQITDAKSFKLNFKYKMVQIGSFDEINGYKSMN